MFVLYNLIEIFFLGQCTPNILEMLYNCIRLSLLCSRTTSPFGIDAREAALARVLLFSLTKDINYITLALQND